MLGTITAFLPIDDMLKNLLSKCDDFPKKNPHSVMTLGHFFSFLIGNYTCCSCIYFIDMDIIFLGRRGAWVQCKHLYHILQNIMYYGQYGKVHLLSHMELGQCSNIFWHLQKHLKANDIIIKLGFCQFWVWLFRFHYSQFNIMYITRIGHVNVGGEFQRMI